MLGPIMSRPQLSARASIWIGITGAVIATLTFVHRGLSQVEKIPTIQAQVDTLRAQAVVNRALNHDMIYMTCVLFQESHTRHEVPAVCESATK